MADRLKGLLDSARTKLGGLLGDFPQGFNAGAVAGIAGYPGDIAFMLDTAGRALTLQDTQPAARDFPGTTEYIAAKAGYPIPDSFSGQLGAAIGGVLTPGPGDLAKFAPVLSAIPFWHGSPHKFDRFDLAHMGKGEGAQAYGWGAYGAESPEVAKQYLNVDPSVPVPPRRQFMGQDLEPGTPEYHAARLASEGKESLAGLRKLVAGWISDARPGEPTDGYQKTLEILNQAQKKSDFKQLKPEPYLYRGEYRWPDPAKEAATPLTGEDLLQWDRPISEQPESVRRAVSELGIVGGNMELPAGGLDMSGGGRILDNRDGKVKPGSVAPYVLVSGDAKFDISEKDLQRMLGGSDDPTGEQIYTRLTAKLGDQNAASKALGALGAPGIRYLDGMSRDGGKGTYNYVMFDDKGIKLLERNGERLGRQPITAYHKTDAEFDEFDPAFFGKNDNGYAGRGVYLTPKPLPGFTYGKDTLKVSAALENPYIRTKDSWNTDPLDPYTWIPKRTEELGGKPQDRTTASKEWTQMMRSKGHDGFIDEATDGGEIVVFDPKQAKILERNGEPLKAAEDFAARRAGKAKPYKEAMGVDTMPAMSKPTETPDYGINHRPPMRNSGAPLYDATGGGNVYPDDVYSAKAQQYYGTGDAKLDRDTFRLLNAYKNEPDAPVTIYRAVPSDVDATDINPGDWVTINKAYADMHGEGFENGYKVIKKQVKARDIYTNGDSIHEWGYDPDGM